MVAVSGDIADKYCAQDILKMLDIRGGGAPGFAMGSFDGILDFSKINL